MELSKQFFYIPR